MRGVLLLWLCACRINFDAQDDADVDAAVDTMPGTTITFGERPTSQRTGVTTDAYASEISPTFNYGGTEDLSLAEFTDNGHHALLRFDLSSLAAGTTVAAARLRVMRLDYGDERPGPIELRVLVESWVEGSTLGAPGPGVSWTTRDGTTAWQVPGGSATATMVTVTPTDPEVTFELDAAIVQGWVDLPATNHGVLLTVGVNTAHYHLHTRSSPLAPDGRPELAIDVVP